MFCCFDSGAERNRIGAGGKKMKKLSLLLLALILISTAACSSKESKNPQPETTPEATAEPVALKDGTYNGYDMQSQQ